MKHTPSAAFVRYSPEIRSAYVERFADAPPATTYYGKGLYLDAATFEHGRQHYEKRTVPHLILTLVATPPRILEVPEPLWTRKTAITLALVVAAKFGALLRRSEVKVVTYCIENELSERLARLPARLPAGVRRAALRPLLKTYEYLVDYWVFGTSASMKTYFEILGTNDTKLRSRSKLVLPLPSACDCQGTRVKKRVVFVGALERRKGVDTLLAAWPAVLASVPGATLHIVGSGPQETEVAQFSAKVASVTWLPSANRNEIHNELRSAEVLVLLSRPERYWREQIGLPILEALAHGVRVVTTSDTGIAEWLVDHGHIVIGNTPSAEEAARAVVRGIESGPPSDALTILPAKNGRAEAAYAMLEATT